MPINKNSNKKISNIFVLIILISISGMVFYFKSAKAENIDEIDTDGDRLPDVKERELGTDPKNKDTDGDGYYDGIEVRTGYDPLKKAPGDKLESPNEDIMNSVLEDVDSESTDQTSLVNEPNLATSNTTENSNVTSTDLSEVDIESILGGEVGENGSYTDDFQKVMEYLSSYYNSSGGQLTLEEMEGVISQFIPEDEVSIDLPVISDNELNLLDTTTVDDLQAYYTAFNGIYYDNLFIPYEDRHKLLDDRGGEYLETYMEDLLNEDLGNMVELQIMYGNIFNSLKEVSVPSEIQQEHKDYLSVMKAYEGIFSDMANAEQDPVKASMALQKYRQSITLKDQFNAKKIEMVQKYNLVI